MADYCYLFINKRTGQPLAGFSHKYMAKCWLQQNKAILYLLRGYRIRTDRHTGDPAPLDPRELLPPQTPG